MRMIDMEGDTNQGGGNYRIWVDEKSKIDLGGLYDPGSIKQGLLQSVLGKDGYPITTGKNKYYTGNEYKTVNNGTANQSLETLFSGGLQVNHLFRQDIYDLTGYYEYSSFENYAYLNQNLNQNTGEFTVYDQIGTPSNSNYYFYQRGNFMPYNQISSDSVSINQNLYDEYGKKLTEDNERYKENLYLTSGTNYQFGMYMEANFIQPKDGMVQKVNKENMRFEFNGDDDLWIYIDNVLILDIGGVHDAHSGYIDFATGEVVVYDSITNGETIERKTTLYDLFREAGRMPDSTEIVEWKNEEVGDYFVQNEDGNYTTLKDYSPHKIKMFYLERGNGASNLHMKFNLEVIPEGQVQVRKELAPESDPVKFGNVEFGFELYVEEQDSEGQGTGALNQVTSLEGYDAKKESADGTESPLQMENGKFYLKPGEVAYINNIPVNLLYEVKEVDVQSDYFDKIEISGTQIKADYSGEESNISYGLSSGRDTVDHRPMVTFINSCNAKNLRTLTIEKKMETGQESDDMFTMHVKLENSNGDLAPFNGSYHLKNENGKTIDANGNIQENDKFRLTTTDGNISIKAGWTISIYSILSDTEFSVTEILGTDQQGEYKTPVYMMTEDDDNQLKEVEKATGTIQLNANAKVQVINGYKSILTVEKQWACITENALPDYIYIGLYKKENADNVNPIKYQKLLAVEDWRTSFTGLEANGEYLVKELVVTSGSGEFEIDGQQYVGVDSGETVSFNGIKFTVDYSPTTIQLTNDSNLITITNTQAWQIVKRSTSEPHPELPGAKFQLEKLDKSGQMTKSIFNGTSDDNGIIQWDNRITPLENGTYLLKETKAPDGYSCGGEWRIVIENGLPKTIEGTLGTDDTATPIGGPTFTCYLNDGVVTVYYDNTPLYNLPSAGSSGIFGYTMGGTLLLMAGTLILYKMKRKEVLGS